MIASCPGFLDRYGIWNNGKTNQSVEICIPKLSLGFDCSSPRICCGNETDRYCCIVSASPVTHFSSSTTIDDSSTNLLLNKWFCLQIFTLGLFVAMTILVFVLIYQCLLSFRRNQRAQTMSFLQVPLPAASPRLVERHRLTANRISTISSIPSDMKSRCTDTSIILNTPLNLYPTGHSVSSTSTSSSYYMFPNEFEHLCK